MGVMVSAVLVAVILAGVPLMVLAIHDAIVDIVDNGDSTR